MISLAPKRFVDSVPKRFHVERAYNVTPPLDDKIKLDLINETEREADPRAYQAMLGSLLYIARATRPGILFAVAALSRYNSKPFTRHLTAERESYNIARP